MTVFLAVIILILWIFSLIIMEIAVEEKATSWQQFHHFYIGTTLLVIAAVLAVLGATGILHRPGTAWGLAATGLLLCADDALEHVTAAIGGLDHAWSPVHSILVPFLWRIPGIPQLGALLDRLCGKKPPAASSQP